MIIVIVIITTPPNHNTATRLALGTVMGTLVDCCRMLPDLLAHAVDGRARGAQRLPGAPRHAPLQVQPVPRQSARRLLQLLQPQRHEVQRAAQPEGGAGAAMVPSEKAAQQSRAVREQRRP